METKNFLFTRFENSLLAILAVFVAAGCSTLKTRDQVRTTTPTGKTPPPYLTPSQPGPNPVVTPLEPTSVSVVEQAPAPVEIPPPQQQGSLNNGGIPKVGLILGPGGARTFAEIGVLQEFQREKIPVVGVGGIEWGAPIAALYSGKGLANEAEWQMSKLKSDDIFKKSLMGGAARPVDAHGLDEFLRLAFGHAHAEDGRLSFACPAWNLSKQQVFLMSRGQFDQLLPYCMAYPPALKPWQGNVAAVREVRMVADYLRAHGATVIVLVNVLPAPNMSRPVSGDEGSAESVLWNEVSAFYAKPIPGVDHVIHLPLGKASTMSFDDHRELLQKGAETGAPLVRELAHRLGL